MARVRKEREIKRSRITVIGEGLTPGDGILAAAGPEKLLFTYKPPKVPVQRRCRYAICFCGLQDIRRNDGSMPVGIVEYVLLRRCHIIGNDNYKLSIFQIIDKI